MEPSKLSYTLSECAMLLHSIHHICKSLSKAFNFLFKTTVAHSSFGPECFIFKIRGGKNGLFKKKKKKEKKNYVFVECFGHKKKFPNTVWI